MANEDMNGDFMGGGALEHVVHAGEIYLNADQLTTLFGAVGTRMMDAARATEDFEGGLAAVMMIDVAEKFNELRSELLKREIEQSFFAPVAEQDEPGK